MKITWVTSILNETDGLFDTIESVKSAQGQYDFEHIIVDGGSGPEVLAYIETFTDMGVTLIYGPDSGIYEAWNKAIRYSRGEWIGFLGVGDRLHPCAVQRYVEVLESVRSDTGGVESVKFVSGRVATESFSSPRRTFGQQWHWNKSRRYMNVAHVGALHHSSLFDCVGLYDESYSIAGDYELLLRAGPSLTTRFVNSTVASMATGGISTSQWSRALKETYRAKKSHSRMSQIVLLWDDLLARIKALGRPIYTGFFQP